MLSGLVLLVLATQKVSAIDNGLGRTPPMGWRSWNCYHGDVDDAKMRATVDALVDKSRPVWGQTQPTSLADVGFNDAGLDDNWQHCNAGVQNSFHDASGNPLIHKESFPDMLAMTTYAHDRGVKMGWYGNNCICNERQFTDKDYIEAHYEGDVKALVAYGFDGIKLDGCGQFLDLDKWANLINTTGRSVMIENCHWGNTVPTEMWCPFNFFRTSGDISASWGSMFKNLQSVIKFLDVDKPLSRPGCWAYPDMLEVGNLPTYAQNRAHFGAWVMTSSPLILGLDLTNNATVDKVWDILTNVEAIAISQQYGGHPGRMERQWHASTNTSAGYMWAVDCNPAVPGQQGFAFDSATSTVQVPSPDGTATWCLDYADASVLSAAPCGSSQTQKFAYDSTAKKLTIPSGDCVDVFNFVGPVVDTYRCNGGCNQQLTFNATSVVDNCATPHPTLCMEVRSTNPGGSIQGQLWVKPLPNKAVAAFVINNDDSNSFVTTIDLAADLGIPGGAKVRDVWNHLDLPTATGKFVTDSVPSYDSRLYVFTPI